MAETDFDLVIAGGGMVGATLAAALAHTPLRIAVIERQAPQGEFPAGRYDARVSAVTRASERILANVGAWAGIGAERAQPFRHIQVWDQGGLGVTRFDSRAAGEPCLGHIVENRLIQYQLWRLLEQAPAIALLCPDELEGLEQGDDALTLQLRAGGALRARLLVGADGGRSRVRQLAGIGTVGWAYGQRTIVGTVTTEQSHRDTAWQRFLPTGPVAFLPLGDGRCSLAWHLDEREAERLLALPEPEFLDALSTASDRALGRVTAIEGRGAFPLFLQHATRYSSGRVVLAGDAAHTVHPLAGQGVNLGFLDAAVLAELLEDAAFAATDPADPELLRRYEQWRRPHNLAAMLTMDAFKRVFGTRFAPLRWARNAGLLLAQMSGPAKTAVMRQAMGLDGPLPRIARTPAPG